MRGGRYKLVYYPHGLDYGEGVEAVYATLDGAYKASRELYMEYATIEDFVVELFRNESAGFDECWVATSFESEWRR